jgi:predicted DCC family thiol-disulfide oxidoreductase YuxK
MNPAAALTAPVLLYDGTCGFCAESVQLVPGTIGADLQFAPRQGALETSVRTNHPELEGVGSMV